MITASRYLSWPALILLFGTVGCTDSEPVVNKALNPVESMAPHDLESRSFTIRDRLGRTVSLPRVPFRIVSLSPSATEMIFALGAGDRLVGATQYCNFPPEALLIERVSSGTIEGVNRESIINTNPDVIFFKADHHQSLIADFEKFGIPMVGVGAESLEEMFQEAIAVGSFLGKESESEQLVSKMRAELKRQQDRVASIPFDGRTRVFYEVWDQPLMTVGPASFIGELLSIAKGENIFNDVTQGYPQISSELVVERDPQVILRPASSASSKEIDNILNRKGWENVSAIKSQRVYLIDGDQISRCGPRLLKVLPSLIDAMYPELRSQ